MTASLTRSARALLASCVVSTLALAQASAGVSDERINLPEAPGSIDGVGENAANEGNQGALTYRVAVELPPGFPGVTPTVDFAYSSSGGSDLLGIGWSMPSYSIERMTSKGLQQYGIDDRFVVEGSDELVRVAQGTGEATYRSRFENGFVRYTWKNRGTGEGGYWTAEYPDGRVGYYGADAQGADVPTARVQVLSSPKTFRWHLVAMVDRYGHALNASWTKDPGGASLLERLDYLYEGAAARHSVRFTYEARNDLLSDGRPGFDLRLTRRLKDVRIFSGTELIRSYVLTYEAEADSGGASRVKTIRRLGRGDVAYPVVFDFDYSKTLAGACAAGCEKPFVKQMGSLGVSFGNGSATLIDMNGDALPDVVSANLTSGAHTIFTSRLDAEGQVSFDTTGRASAITATAFKLGTPSVQLLDINGDGFMDLTEARTNEVLCNDGSGDWAPTTFCKAAGSGVAADYVTDDADTGQVDPFHVRFFDYDNDKRIDWLRTDSASSTTVLVNTPTGNVAQSVQAIGYVFDESTLQLADMNGDGLQDPVLFNTLANPVNVTYRLNFGRGTWGPEVNIPVSGFTSSQATRAELQDINGDGLADVVAVLANEVYYAINRNGARFDAMRVIRSADLGAGAIPDTSAMGSIVSYADMNGNGSDDIVFIIGGAISYLELFPVRPNLISRIDNGIGGVQLFKYGTSIAEQARDAMAGMPWVNKVPNPMTLVTRSENFVTLTGNDTGGLKEITSFRYHSGFYDGVEKQFRGYEGVERELLSDMSRDAQEPGLVVETYDVGKTNPLFAGRALSSQTFAGAAAPRVLLREQRSTWEACPVAQVPMGTTPAVAFACERATTSLVVERDVANAVTQRIERDFDGYGNVVKERNLGVVNRGTPEAPTACGACTASGTFGDACGPTCLGDERFSENEYVEPGTATGGLWLLNLPRREASGAVGDMMMTETRTYYDGPDFEGLALGQLTKGGVSRVERRNGPGANDFLTVDRFRRDTHGNVLEHISANGTVADSTRNRRVYTYDATGSHVASVELRVAGNGYTGVRREVVYEPSFEKMSQSSNWVPVMGATALATPQLTRYRYDEHGRLSRVLDPGDTDAAPSQLIDFALASPASRITITQASATSGGEPQVTARCLDGRGRVFQVRDRLSATSWQVSGFTEFDGRGAIARRYQPYLGTSGACDMAPPANVPFTTFRYDPVGRQLTETEPDGAVRRVEYGPNVTRYLDEDDTDAAGPHANTPVVETRDGLGRITSIARTQSGGATAALTRLSYDAMGELATVRDAADHLRTQTFDRRRNLVRVDDTNFGSLQLEYDANGNVVKRTESTGEVIRSEFDGANRVSATWDDGDRAGTERTWAYDRLMGCAECTNAGGLVVQATWSGSTAGGQDRFGYDADGNLVYTQRTIGGVPFAIRRTFDKLDRELTTTYPGGLSLTRTWDGAGRLASIAGAVTAVAYDARGDVSRLDFANGASTEYSYDGRRRLAGLTTKGADGTALLQLGYTRAPSGDLKAITDGALAGRVRHAATITNDAWSRVTRVELAREEGTETLDFTYDAIDNVLSATSSLGAQSRAHVGAYTYDAARPNAVTAAGALALTYDAAGRLATRGGVAYARDADGRITSATGGAVDGRFTWNEGERVAKEEGDAVTWYVDRDFEVRDGIATVYARLGDARVTRLESDALAATILSDLAPATGTGPLTVTGDGTIDIADAWLAQASATGVVQVTGGPAVSSVGRLLRSSARRLLMADATWLHPDHLRSAVLATDEAGAVRGEQSFYPTGEVKAQQGYVDVHGFTNQERDESTGLLHFRNRDLDTRTGRWDMADPAFEQLQADQARYLGQATVGYAYVGNAFYDAYDPTGLAATDAKDTTAKKPMSKRDRALKKTQIVANVLGAVLNIVSAIVSSTSSSYGDSAAQAASGLSIAGNLSGGVGTGIGAYFDAKALREDSKSASGKDAPATQPQPGGDPAPTPTVTNTSTTATTGDASGSGGGGSTNPSPSASPSSSGLPKSLQGKPLPPLPKGPRPVPPATKPLSPSGGGGGGGAPTQTSSSRQVI